MQLPRLSAAIGPLPHALSGGSVLVPRLLRSCSTQSACLRGSNRSNNGGSSCSSSRSSGHSTSGSSSDRSSASGGGGRRRTDHGNTQPCVARAAAQGVAGADMDSDNCSILNVILDNNVDAKYSILTIEVMGYPGLLRTVAWTLNGLGVRAQNANMTTDDDGYVVLKFWLTDMQYKRLSSRMADNVRDSLYDFVQTCMPPPGKEQEEWRYGNTVISNKSHAKYTELVISGEPTKPGFLLEIATVLGASGATVQGMTIQGDNNFECVLECPAMFDHDFENMGRCFRFLLKEGSSGEKLSAGRVASVLYMLDLVAGKGYQPTSLSSTPDIFGRT